VRAAASKHGWNVVSYNSEFQYHGYTDPEPWVVRLAESSRDQRDQMGVLHPNRRGHEVIGGKLYERMFADKRPYTSFNSLFYKPNYSVTEGGSLSLGGTPAAGVLYEWDLDGDGVVGGSDLAILLGSWGSCPAAAPCVADLNGDGNVGADDLAVLLGGWN
jgi:hypothetical protein